MDFKIEKLKRVYADQIFNDCWVFLEPDATTTFFDAPVKITGLSKERYFCYRHYGRTLFDICFYDDSSGFYDIPICDGTLRAFGFEPTDGSSLPVLDLVAYRMDYKKREIYLIVCDDVFKLSLLKESGESIMVTVQSIRDIQYWYKLFYGTPLYLNCMCDGDGEFTIPLTHLS